MTAHVDSAASASANVTDFEPPSISSLPADQSVAAGQPAEYQITVSPNTGITTEETTFSCQSNSLPTGVTCVFNPPKLTFGPNSASLQLAVSTTGQTDLTSDSPPNRSNRGLLYAFGVVCAAAGARAAMTLKRKRYRMAVNAVADLPGVRQPKEFVLPGETVALRNGTQPAERTFTTPASFPSLAELGVKKMAAQSG